MTIACIVEGHGEVEAVPILLRRLVAEIAPSQSIEIRRPIRITEGKIKRRPEELGRYVQLAKTQVGLGGAILILADADDEEGCPAELGPRLLKQAQAVRADASIVVVLAKREFESWFLAAAESLRGQRGFPTDLETPRDPEAIRGAKEWLSRCRTFRYEETIDQPALAAVFDVHRARERSPSFDKLWREVQGLLERSPA